MLARYRNALLLALPIGAAISLAVALVRSSTVPLSVAGTWSVALVALGVGLVVAGVSAGAAFGALVLLDRRMERSTAFRVGGAVAAAAVAVLLVGLAAETALTAVLPLEDRGGVLLLAAVAMAPAGALAGSAVLLSDLGAAIGPSRARPAAAG